jgi:hypothetical protein
MVTIPDLSEALAPMFQWELEHGNIVARVDRPAGSSCPLAIIFVKPLDFEGFASANSTPPGVRTWKNTDPHYPLEKGYACAHTGQALAGPFPK